MGNLGMGNCAKCGGVVYGNGTYGTAGSGGTGAATYALYHPGCAPQPAPLLMPCDAELADLRARLAACEKEREAFRIGLNVEQERVAELRGYADRYERERDAARAEAAVLREALEQIEAVPTPTTLRQAESTVRVMRSIAGGAVAGDAAPELLRRAEEWEALRAFLLEALLTEIDGRLDSVISELKAGVYAPTKT